MDTIFYDGQCGLCHRAVRFLVAQDRYGERFRFAALDSRTFRAAFAEQERQKFPDSLIVLTGDSVVLTRSAATVHLLHRLDNRGWRVLGTLLSWVPLRARDALYDSMARIRHRLFAPPAETCPLLPPELRARFLD